jgi:cyclophilin family peptidyl-prolyl cis-trans isomerase
MQWGVFMFFLAMTVGDTRGQVLDFADQIIAESEPNDDPNFPQILPFDPFSDIFAIGVQGDLSDPRDVDAFGFEIQPDEQLDLKFELAQGTDLEITALAAGPDGFSYFAAGGIWRKEINNAQSQAEIVVTSSVLEEELGIDPNDLRVKDIAVTQVDDAIRIYLTLSGRGDVVEIDDLGNIRIVISEDQITARTGQSSAELVSIEILENGILVTPEADPNTNPIVTLETNFGDIVLELFQQDTPITVANFLDYVNTGFFDGLIFHRTIDNFVIQAGAYDPNLYNDFDPNFFLDPQWPRSPIFFHPPNDPITSEAFNQRRNNRGFVAMALSGSNADSGTSQFFINLVDNNFLDFDDPSPPPFTVFAEVIEGMEEVADVIGAGPTINISSFSDVPENPVIIERATTQTPTPLLFPVLVADAVSGQVLQVTENFDEVDFFARSSHITETLREEMLDNGPISLISGVTPLPRTPLADTDEPFGANAILSIEGSGLYPDGFYISQLGTAFGGDGSVTRVEPNEVEPAGARFIKLFDPTDEEQDVNPSALAFDSEGSFGGKLFVGTFGPSLGDDFDGQVFTLEPDGSLNNFVTSFVDMNGDPVIREPNVVDGFFDVTDMRFSDGGAFGNFLYVISENIDSNGAAEGGFSSDIWRVDPSGVAHLFAGQIADGVITLDFGTFGYGGDLYLGTFQNPARILRVDSSGNFTTLFNFAPLADSLAVSDLVFAPVNSLFNGGLLVSLQSGQENFLLEVDSNTDGFTTPTVWGRGITPGDVSSGDLVFDQAENLYVLQQADSQVTRLDYQNLLDYELLDMQIRSFIEEAEDPQEPGTPRAIAHVLLRSAEQPRLVSLGEAGDPADIATVVNPATLDVPNPDEEDETERVALTFDDQGDLFVFIQNSGSLRSGPFNDTSGLFDQLSEQVTTGDVDTNTDLQDSQIFQLAWADGGDLLAIGANGTQAADGAEPPSQEFDDAVINLGNTTFGSFTPQFETSISDLPQMTLALAGPDLDETLTVSLGELVEESFLDLTDGDYGVSIQSVGDLTGNYELLLARGGELENTVTVDEADGPVNLSLLDGDTLILQVTGLGQAALRVSQQPGSGTVLETHSLALTGTSGKTEVSLVNPSQPEQIFLESLTLGGSLSRLQYAGSVDSIDSTDGSTGKISLAEMGIVRNLDAPGYRFGEFHADVLGDPNVTARIFNARGLTTLLAGDIHNMTFLNSTTGNLYNRIIVDGVMTGSTFFGRFLKLLEVNNASNLDVAVDNCAFTITDTRGWIQEIQVKTGSVIDTTITGRKRIVLMEVRNGNLERCNITAANIGGKIGELLVLREEALPSENLGNIIDTQITAFLRIDRLHADGEISGTSTIGASSSFSSTVKLLTCGGTLSGSLNSVRLDRILVGYDQFAKRLPEPQNGEFTGADFTGSMNVTFRIKELNVTGMISGASVQVSSGNISEIFAEDGMENISFNSANLISRILVGYLNGKRGQIENEQADVSGTINARRLGRLYYTGENSADLSSVRRRGPIVDDVPN